AAGAAPVVQVDPEVEAHAIADVKAWRDGRDASAVDASLSALRAAAVSSANLMASTLECVRAGVTTGEWAAVLRSVFGEYRAPTGLSGSGLGSTSDTAGSSLSALRERVRATAAELGAARLRLLVGKPGLDGHSNGAEQIAVRARDAGFEVIYQ